MPHTDVAVSQLTLALAHTFCLQAVVKPTDKQLDAAVALFMAFVDKHL